MTTYSRLKSTLLAAVIAAIILPAQLHATEYKWLKTHKYEKLFVYTDFEECDFMAKELYKTIRVLLLRSKIKSTISNSLVFQSENKNDKSIRELLDEELINNRKVFMHIYGKCIEYDDVIIYQFSIHFARFDNKYSSPLLYSSPEHNVMGAENYYGIKNAFKKLVEAAVEDYISANRK